MVNNDQIGLVELPKWVGTSNRSSVDFCHRLTSGPHMQFPQHLLHVLVDGGYGYSEAVGNFLVGPASTKLGQDLLLPFCHGATDRDQRGRGGRPRAEHVAEPSNAHRWRGQLSG